MNVPEGRIALLYARDSLSALDESKLVAALSDSHPEVRRHALRLSEPLLNSSAQVRKAALKLAGDKDPVVPPTATRTHVVLAAESGGERRVRTVVLSPHLAWTFVAPFGVVYDRWGPFVTLLWVTVLVLPIAYWSRRTAPHGPTRVGAPRTAALLAVILVTMGGASWLAGLAPMPWWEWLGAAAGATLGWALGGRWSASPASCRERSPRRVFAA